MILTATRQSPDIAKPNLSGALSWKTAFRGSQMPQQKATNAADATNSTTNACQGKTSTCGATTHKPFPALPILRISFDVIKMIKPYPMNAPTNCPTIYKHIVWRRDGDHNVIKFKRKKINELLTFAHHHIVFDYTKLTCTSIRLYTAAATDTAGLMCAPETHPNIWIEIIATIPKLRQVWRWLYSLPQVKHPKQPKNTRMPVPNVSLKNTDNRSINRLLSAIIFVNEWTRDFTQTRNLDEREKFDKFTQEKNKKRKINFTIE